MTAIDGNDGWVDYQGNYSIYAFQTPRGYTPGAGVSFLDTVAQFGYLKQYANSTSPLTPGTTYAPDSSGEVRFFYVAVNGTNASGIVIAEDIFEYVFVLGSSIGPVNFLYAQVLNSFVPCTAPGSCVAFANCKQGNYTYPPVDIIHPNSDQHNRFLLYLISTIARNTE